MYRTFLSTALMAMLFLTGCGGSGKTENADNKNSENKSGETQTAQTKTESKPSTSEPSPSKAVDLTEDQMADIGLEIDFASLFKDDVVAAGMKSVPDVPPFVMAMTSTTAYVSVPSNMEMAMNPAGYDFYVSTSFGTEDACKAAFQMLSMSGVPMQDMEKNGKTYKTIAAPGAPPVFILQEGNKIQAFSQKYLDSGLTSFASPSLKKALGSIPSSQQFKLGIDMDGAREVINTMGAMAPPQAQSVLASKTLVIGGGTGDTMMMLAVEAQDEDSAKKVKGSIQAGVAAMALAAAAQMPSAEVAPATNEMYNHCMSNLKPKVEGAMVKVEITKPDNYAELTKKITEETEKIKEEMMKRGLGGQPGLNAPK